MFIKQPFPLVDPLPLITRHDDLPADARLLGSMIQLKSGREYLYCYLMRQDRFLSILSSATYQTRDGVVQYICNQSDFPLRVLSWFPTALELFRRPPAEDGLHAGAMQSKYENVDGEMLTVGSTTQGYVLDNWSRSDQKLEFYMPISLDLDFDFLYHDGFLKLWSDLGERYERGELF